MKLEWHESNVNYTTLIQSEPNTYKRFASVYVAYYRTESCAPNEVQIVWQAQITETSQRKTFDTKDQAKDWAQAVVLLTH
jgi:uncharacterized protein YifE (UPF0438 family)